MIVGFRSKALERFWTKGQRKHVRQDHVKKLTSILERLEDATGPGDMNYPGFGLHPLTGDQAGRYAVTVKNNWRVTFGWSDQGAVDVDYEDYH